MAVILHCDLNNFYASVECHLNPLLKLLPVAVCGSAENRHGIVLAKNDIAKKCGVSTGETIWQARQKCSNLTIVSPHYSQYFKYSRAARAIYSKYTDLIEPFGIDECWLDMTGSALIFGSGKDIADKLRQEIQDSLGVTISVGVSFNKVFAKLGSDMKKPNATTIITKENFKEKVWCLPAEEMIGVGKSTITKLRGVGIYTIGDIAHCSSEYMYKLLGKNGFKLWQYANGLDNSIVSHEEFVSEAKSIGNSSTCIRDITCDSDAHKVILSLSEEVCKRLRKSKLLASNIIISIKDPNFHTCEYTIQLTSPSSVTSVIAGNAIALLSENWKWHSNIRAIGIRAANLHNITSGKQLSLFIDYNKERKAETLESSIDALREKYGRECIMRGTLMLPSLMPSFNTTQEVHMPNFTSK